MVEKLQQWGCNTEEALERFVGDNDLYIMCMNLFIGDGSFDELGKAIESNDIDAAFNACHTLKGVAGNVSAGPLFEAIENLTERLRAKDGTGMAEDYQKIIALKDELATLLAS